MATTLTPTERDALVNQFEVLAQEPSFRLLTRRRLSRLAGVSSDDAPIVSLFLDLGPQARQNRKWAIVLKNLARDALARVPDRSHARQAEQEIARLEDAIAGGLPDLGRGMAVFSSQPIGLREEVVFPRALANRLEIDRRPYLRPLFRQLDEQDRFLVVLLDAERARMFVSQLGMIHEVADLIGEATTQTRKGMFAELRFERQRDSHVLWHAGVVAHATTLAMEHFGAKWLLVSGSSEVLADYRKHLPPAVGQRLADDFSVPIVSSPSDVAQAVGPLQDEVEAREEHATIDRLEAEPAGGKAVWGLSDTLRTVSNGRVHTLVVLDDYHAPGGECPDCGLVVADTAGGCSGCGEDLVVVDDVVDLALERAFQQSAALELVRNTEARSRMMSREPIAALLRY